MWLIQSEFSIGNIYFIKCSVRKTDTKTCIAVPNESNQASEVLENVPMTSSTAFLKMTAGKQKLFGNLHWLVIMKNYKS